LNEPVYDYRYASVGGIEQVRNDANVHQLALWSTMVFTSSYYPDIAHDIIHHTG
jgi:hypothetical protein